MSGLFGWPNSAINPRAVKTTATISLCHWKWQMNDDFFMWIICLKTDICIVVSLYEWKKYCYLGMLVFLHNLWCWVSNASNFICNICDLSNNSLVVNKDKLSKITTQTKLAVKNEGRYISGVVLKACRITWRFIEFNCKCLVISPWQFQKFT